jgi:hypothetical protein
MEFTKEENIINDDFLNSLIYELTVKPENRQQQKFDFEPLNYNHYFTDNAEDFIKQKLKITLNDPYINKFVEETAKQIKKEDKTPLDDWRERQFINNNNNNKEN